MLQKDRFFPDFQETITRTFLTYMLFNDNRPRDEYTDMCELPSEPSISDDDCHPNIPYSYEYGYSHITYDLAEMHPFLCYSLVHWAYHARELQQLMEKEIIEFLDSACCKEVTKVFHAAEFFTEGEHPHIALVPLHFAVEYGLLHITKVLLERGDDPSQCSPPLLETAVDRENLSMVKLLLGRHEIDPNAKGWNLPLCSACACKDKQILEVFLQSDRVDVNCRDCTGATALMMAVTSGYVSGVEALLKHPKIDIMARDRRGRSAYAYAFGGYQEVPDCSDKNGMIALLERYGGKPQTDYEPTYPTAAAGLSNEQLTNSGLRIPLDSSTPFPQDLTGPPPCHDDNGHPIYIGSAIFGNCVLPCKIGPHLPVPCLVPFRGREIAHTERYDLLPFNPDTMEFVRTSGKRSPAGRKPVKGGHEQGGRPLYHSVAVVNGIRIPGIVKSRLYVLPSVGCCRWLMSSLGVNAQ